MVPAVRFLYLAFCDQGASTNGVDAKVFYWTRNETSWNLCGGWNSNLKTSHYLKIIPIHWPLEKTKSNLHTGRTGINMKQNHSGKRWQAIENGWKQHTPQKTKSRPLSKFLWNDAFFMTLTPPLPTQVWPKFLSLPECGSNGFAKAAFIDAGRWSLVASGWLKKNNWIKEMGAHVLFSSLLRGWNPYVLIPGARRAPRLDGTSCQLPCES